MNGADPAAALDRLAAAAAALQVPDPAAALDALLDAWRLTRSPRIADLIDALTAIVSRALPALVEPRRKRFHEAWLDLANAQRAVDVGVLLDAWTTPPWSSLRERVDRLALRPDDPRIALALARFVEQMPTTNSAGEATWTAIVRLLTKTGDVRCRAPIAARLRAGGPGVFWEKLAPRLQLVQEALVAVKPIDPVEAVIDAVQVRLTALRRGPAVPEAVLRRPKPKGEGPTEEQLLQRIYDQPADDAARQIFADFCVERGDPRGELIALQFKPKPTLKEQRQIRDLLKAHGRSWLGPIEPAVAPRTEQFARGFLSTCHLNFRTAAQREALLLHPAWNTLTLVSTWEDRDGYFLLPHPLKGLEAIDGVLAPELAMKMALRRTPYPRLRQLAVDLTTAGPEHLAAIGEAAAFPALTSLSLQALHEREPPPLALAAFAWLLGSKAMARLEVLGLAHLQVNLIDWLTKLRDFPALLRFDVSGWPAIAFFRDGAGWQARVNPLHPADDGARAVLSPIARAGLLTAVQLPPAKDAGERARFAAALQGVPVIEARA